MIAIQIYIISTHDYKNQRVNCELQKSFKLLVDSNFHPTLAAGTQVVEDSTKEKKIVITLCSG